jgi:L-lactate utilization protein LutC
LREVKEEAKELIITRVHMARAKLSEKVSTLKIVAPLAFVGAALGAMAFLLLSVALVAAIAWLLGNAAHAWAAAFTIVGALYGLAGVICLASAASVLRSHSLMPERTLRVLKQDQIWIQTGLGCNHDRCLDSRSTGAARASTAAAAS